MKRKVIYIATPLILAAMTTGLVLANKEEQEPVKQEQANIEVVEPTKPVEAPVTPAETEEVKDTTVITTNAPVAPESVTGAPTVLSTQEYAEQYLDMSVPRAQQCLDAIVTTWSARFNEDVREDNIKSLRAWANLCTTGMFTPNDTTALIYQYGANGEFFDSALAKSKH